MSKPLRQIVLGLILLIGFPAAIPAYTSQAASSTIYTDGKLASDCTNGNYSIANRDCSGSDGNAYKTVQAGIDALIPGGTLYIRSGTYKEIWQNGDYQEASFFVDLDSSGTKAATIAGYPGESRPVLTYKPDDLPRWSANPDSQGTYYLGPIVHLGDHASNLTFQHLEIVGYRNAGVQFHQYGEICLGDGGDVHAEGKIITVRDLSIHDCLHAGIKGRWAYKIYDTQIYNIGVGSKDKTDFLIQNGGDIFGQAHGIYVQGDNGEVIGNYIHNIGSGLPGGDGIDIYDDPAGCFTDTGTKCTNSPHDWVLAYNILHDFNLSGIDIVAHNIQIYNNVITRAALKEPPTGEGGLTLQKDATYNITIRNNILWGNYNADVFLDRPILPITHDHNLIGYIASYDVAEWGGSTNEPGGLYHVDPGFIATNPSSWRDFSLSSTSPAIDAGVDLGSTLNSDALDPASTGWPPDFVDQSDYGTGWEMGADAG